MTLARTQATGAGGLDGKVLAFTSSLEHDLKLVTEDVLGSAAHVVMLARVGLLPPEEAKAIRGALLEVLTSKVPLPNEEDVHMAVEAHLTQKLGEPARRLHTARSRNDQVSLDLRLHVREQARTTVLTLTGLVKTLVERAKQDQALVLPAYTHRQRAQPVSLAYWWLAWASGFARDAETFVHAMAQADVLSLGVGAISGSSLPIDRGITQELLGFSRMTLNGLDTVGDRDFALDFLQAAAKCMVRVGRLGTDVIDFSTSEFGFLKLSDAISMGSSMMPQKKNPDVFELLRGRSGAQLGDLMGLFAIMKGLPGGYSRDQQEDRGPLLGTCQRLRENLELLAIGLPQVSFVADKCLAAVSDGGTQATDLAEALVSRGLPFREAYKRAGALVAEARKRNVGLAQLSLEQAKAVEPMADEALLARLEPKNAAAAKQVKGGTGPASIEWQLGELRARADALVAQAEKVPSLSTLVTRLQEASIP